jgi:hypothetical protein
MFCDNNSGATRDGGGPFLVQAGSLLIGCRNKLPECGVGGVDSGLSEAGYVAWVTALRGIE